MTPIATIALSALILSTLSCAGDERSAAQGGRSEGERLRRGNRLARERSPYLLQHANNPVDLHPWGEEALESARKENKPIFLSIGYSTCHWCHVMEHESFEDDSVAKVLNEHFIAIKVDREERPDLDNLYMSAVHAMGSRGGWPLTVILTPALEPFFGGTYFPREDRGGRVGLLTILNKVAGVWKNDPSRIVGSASQVTEFLRQQAMRIDSMAVAGQPDEKLLDAAFADLRESFDWEHGGFGGGTKFPTPHNLSFLLRYSARSGNSEALKMVRMTLDHMAAGGIHDHLGGGFHRYATEREWLVPHFEKMLYDQAGLVIAYTDAWLVDKDSTYAEVIRDILRYVLDDLHDPAGGFYSAEDADSEGEEGKFYIWSAAEIDEVLGREGGEGFRIAYGVRSGGNWEGKNILNRIGKASPLAPGLDDERAALLAIRARRPRPHLDDKIITAWNGFMIEALARAARALDRPDYADAAAKAAAFIDENLWRNGRLLRHYRRGAAEIPAYLDDYAFLGRGRLALYEATFDVRHLEAAIRLAREMDRLFLRSKGGYSYTGSDVEPLLVPVVETYDGALPSGNSAAATLLLRLGHLIADHELEERGRATIRSFAGLLQQSPASHVEMFSALDLAHGPYTEIVIAGSKSDPRAASLWATVWDHYLPNAVTAFHPIDGEAEVIALVPYLANQGALDGRPTAYVCRDYTCRFPVHDPPALAQLLIEN